MKLFKPLDANRHTRLLRFVSMCLMLCFLLGICPVMGFATGNGLTSLSVSGVSVIAFDPAQTEYTIYIPQTYENGEAVTPEVPTVYAEAEGASVDIIYPDTAEDGSVITVTATSEGGEQTVYTLTLDMIGENMYENGGFEEDGIPMTTASQVVTEKIMDNPASGSYSLAYTFSASLAFMSPQPTMSAGKTYLSSRAIRRTAETVEANNSLERTKRINYYIDRLPSGSVTAMSFPSENIYSSATTAYGIIPPEDWQTFYLTITPSADYVDQQSFVLGSWSNAASNVLAMDNCFLGELVVGSVKVTTAGGADLGKLIKPETGSDSVELGAQIYNQLGTKHGLEGIAVARWELAEDYPDVSIDEDGVLTYGSEAPSSVIVRAYADMDENSLQNSGVKGEIEIELAGVEELAAAELADIQIGGFAVPGYSPSKASYSMYLPYSYDPNEPRLPEEPEIIVTPALEDTTYTIEYPAELDGGIIKIIATAADGTEKVYSIAMHVVGENLYENSGFEESTIPYSTGKNGTAERITDNPGDGTYSLEVGFTGDLFGFTPQATLAAGKTYFSSRMIRKTEKTRIDSTTPSEDINFRMDGLSGKSSLSFGGQEIEYKNTSYAITPTDAWKTVNALIIPTSDWNDKQMYHTSGWTTWNWLALDNCFLGELTVGNIEYQGETQLAIPETGSKTYQLAAQLQNQMGTGYGLEKETIVWDLAGEYEGISVENDTITVTDTAREQTIYLRATTQPSFGNGYKVAKSFPLELVSNSAYAEIPKALHVQASGIVEKGQVLSGSYTYHNVKNIPESDTTFAWLYANSETGTRYPIEGETEQTFTVTEEYINKYIFFQVTPGSVEGKVGTPVVSSFLMKPIAPEAVKPEITGGGYVGSEAQGVYTFLDKNGDAESGSSYRWLRSGDKNGPYKAIEGATGATYTVTEDDIDQYICFEVTPKAGVVPADGQAAISEGVLLAAKPMVKDVSITKVSDGSYRVSYTYEHPLGIAEGVCRIEWYIDDDAAGTGTSATVPRGAEKISVVVTPVASQAPYEGTSVKVSRGISGKSDTVISSGKGGSGNGGASLRGSSNIVPIPVPTPEPVVVEPERHWAADGIDFVKSRGIMQNPEPDNFCNSRLVTRAEFIYYVMKTLGVQEAAYAFEFQDVSGDDYYAGLLQAAVDAGIISKDTHFNPNRSVSRQEICKILVLASDLKAKNEPNLEKFADEASISEWARGYVAASVETGLLRGVSETEFLPAGAVTREQTAVMLKRLFDYKNGGVIA